MLIAQPRQHHAYLPTHPPQSPRPLALARTTSIARLPCGRHCEHLKELVRLARQAGGVVRLAKALLSLQEEI